MWHLIDVLEVEPGVEGSDGQVQVRELELGEPRAGVALLGVDAEARKAQTDLFQGRDVQGDGEALVKQHGEGVGLDLKMK